MGQSQSSRHDPTRMLSWRWVPHPHRITNSRAKVHHMRTNSKPTHPNQINHLKRIELHRRASEPLAMADDDDDDFFGDFKFASKPHSLPPTTTVPVDVNSIAAARDSISDDDWGDFVTTRSVHVNGGDSAAANRGDSAFGWAKPSGALPLSLFGEAEEDAEKPGAAGSGFGADSILFDKRDDRSDDTSKKIKDSSLNGGAGIGDLISNLYGESVKVNDQNGLEASSKADKAVSNAKSSNWMNNGGDFISRDVNLSSNELDFGGTGLNSNSYGSSLDGVQQIENFEDEEDDGWEFKGADEEKQENRTVEGQGTEVAILAGKDEEMQVDGSRRVNMEELRPTPELSNGSHVLSSTETSIPSKDASNSVWNLGFDFDQSSNSAEIGLNSSSVVDKENFHDTLWQFEDAFPQTGAEAKMEAVKVSAHTNLEGKSNGNGSYGPTNFFAVPEEAFHRPQEWDFASTFDSMSLSEDHVTKDVTSKSMVNDIVYGLSSSTDNQHVESLDTSWEFQAAFSEPGLKYEANEIKSETHREALPLSLFGDEELETNVASVDQDVPNHTPTSNTRNSSNASGPNISINDLISSLYGEAEQSTTVQDTPKILENGLTPTTKAFESDPVYPIDDDSWEFQDAKEQNQTFVTDFEAAQSSTKLEFNDFVDFYHKLKDEACTVALSHFKNPKKAQSSSLFGEDSEEIQNLLHRFCHDYEISDVQLEDLSSRSSNIGEILRVLQQPNFRLLESEYQLSNLLSRAEEDLSSAVELAQHATSTLRIVELRSAEEQSAYASVWSKIAMACAREMRHGASILMQALQKKVQNEILLEPRGKQYIMALGEIYRVVQIIRASVKLYKPYILLDSEESVGLFALLNELSSLWSTSGLHEALENIAESTDSDLDGTFRELLDSIAYIHSLDALALQNIIFSGKQTVCQLSLLTSEFVPGMKMVVWDEDRYFLKLANLWANLISSNPPDLPRLSFS